MLNVYRFLNSIADAARSLMKVYNMPCRYTDCLYVYNIEKRKKKSSYRRLYLNLVHAYSIIIFIISSVWREKLFV